MNDNLTELVFILDESGSMYEMTKDTIGGFNSMIDQQKKLEGEVLVSAVLFNDFSHVLYDRVPLSQVRPMTDNDYRAGGGTALYDAVGQAIHHIGKLHKSMDKKDRPGKTLFVITTDGYENSSTHYTGQKVRQMIEKKKEKGWEFLFLGANIDAIATAESIGINRDRAANFHSDSQGTELNYEVLSKTIGGFRTKRFISPVWNEEITEDFENRKEKKK